MNDSPDSYERRFSCVICGYGDVKIEPWELYRCSRCNIRYMGVIRDGHYRMLILSVEKGMKPALSFEPITCSQCGNLMSVMHYDREPGIINCPVCGFRNDLRFIRKKR